MPALDTQVKIHDPDRSLQIKIGVSNLDQVFTAQAVAAAQNVIEQSSESFLTESLEIMPELSRACQILTDNPSIAEGALAKLIGAAFQIKTKTGQGGYTLVADIAKSLQLHAEQMEKAGRSDHALQIISWHVQSLRQIMALKIKGRGGEVGEAILKEIDRLAPKGE